MAIENRFYLGHFFGRDPHSGLMFGSILPRIIANMYSKIVNKKPYETYIYSYYELRELLHCAGFKKNSFFIPFPGYQLPEDVYELNNKKDLIKAIDRCKVDDFKKLAGKIIIKLNLSKIFLHNFIVISKKY